jgi:hypothetical protein
MANEDGNAVVVRNGHRGIRNGSQHR